MKERARFVTEAALEEFPFVLPMSTAMAENRMAGFVGGIFAPLLDSKKVAMLEWVKEKQHYIKYYEHLGAEQSYWGLAVIRKGNINIKCIRHSL